MKSSVRSEVSLLVNTERKRTEWWVLGFTSTLQILRRSKFTEL